MASCPDISATGFPRLFVSNIPTHIPTHEVDLKAQFKEVEVLNVEAGVAAGTAFVTLAGPQGVQQLLMGEYSIGGRKLKISYLRSESARLMLHKPTVTGITTEQVKQLADKWQLRCTNQEGKGVIVSGLRERISRFCFDLDYYQSRSAHCGTLPLGQSGASMDQQAFTQLNANPDHIAQSNALPKPATAGAEPQAIPPTLTTGSETRQVFSDLSPDALALLKKIPEGEIQGVEYNPEAGTVMISCQSKDEVEDRISKFQVAYQKILSSRHLKAEPVEVPPALDGSETASLVAAFNHQYNQTVFTYHPDLRVIKIVSISSRQFDQAKKQLLDRLHSRESSTETDMSGIEVIHLSNGRKLTLKKANIVEENVYIIVNAANGQLKHSGGVAGALNKASHGQLQRYSDACVRQKGTIEVGHVTVTHGGGALKCRLVIHAVGPDNTFSQSECKQLLARAIRRSFFEAERCNAESIAFPAISSGIFGVSKDLVAQTMIDTILSFEFVKNPPVLSDIRIVIIDHPTHSCFARHFRQKMAATEFGRKQGLESKSVRRGQLRDQEYEGATKQPEPTLLMQSSNPSPSSPLEGTPITMESLSQLVDKLLPLAAKWQILGLQLGLSPEILMEIQAGEARFGESVYLSKMLTKWLTLSPLPPTLEMLTNALSSPAIEGERLVWSLQSHFQEGRDRNLIGNQHPHSKISLPALPPSTDPLPPLPESPPEPPQQPPSLGSGACGIHPQATTTDPLLNSYDYTSSPQGPSVPATKTTYAGAASGQSQTTKKSGGGKRKVQKGKDHPAAGKRDHRSKSPSGATAAPEASCPGALRGEGKCFSPPPRKHLECSICMEKLKNPTQTKCGHKFCSQCLNTALQYSPYCPTCRKALRRITGNQPPGGTMTERVIHSSLPGYPRCKTTEITYVIPGGTQGQEHPNPGRRYTGTTRYAYLPDNYEGREVLALLRKAFRARLTFTVGTSVTSGAQNTVVWNDIHHKTSMSGGSYGYPDPTYLQRVKDDLAAKGIVPDSSRV